MCECVSVSAAPATSSHPGESVCVYESVEIWRQETHYSYLSSPAYLTPPHNNPPPNNKPPHNKLGGDKNPIEVADQSKEFATYLYFPGERGIGDEDSEEGMGDKELVGIRSMEGDLAKDEERTKTLGKDLDKAGFQKRIWAAWGLKKSGPKPNFDPKSAKTAILSIAKALNKVETDVTAIVEEEEEEKTKQHWMKKYYRRLG